MYLCADKCTDFCISHSELHSSVYVFLLQLYSSIQSEMSIFSIHTWTLPVETKIEIARNCFRYFKEKRMYAQTIQDIIGEYVIYVLYLVLCNF